jgi:hypothetical protein
VSRIAYELAGRDAMLVVDVGAGVAGWRLRDRECAVADVLHVAPADEVEALLRRALLETRARATAAEGGGAALRELAAAVWRDYRSAIDGVGGQPTLPGMP